MKKRDPAIKRVLGIIGSISFCFVCILIMIWLIGIVISIGFLSLGGGTIAKYHREYSNVLSVNTYESTFQNYKVRLEEIATREYYKNDNPLIEPIIIVFGSFLEIKRKNVQKFIHLTPLNENVRPYALTGHDYGNGNFDRVFIVKLPENGYNAVYKKWFGWKFEPCPADKGKVKPFTKKEILDAIKVLNEALAST